LSNINFNLGSNLNKFGTGTNSSNPSVESQMITNTSQENTIMSLITSELTNNLNLFAERMFSNLLKLNLLQGSDFAKLVKELLNFPKDIQELLATLAFGDNTPETLLKLLDDPNAKVLISELQKIFTQNSKEVLNKLINLTQNNALFYEGNEQLRDILGFIQKLVTIVQKSPADALAVTMLLYLPWLPLVEQQKLELGFQFEEESKNASNKEEVLVMFITTRHLGIFKITITVKNLYDIQIDIENDQLASSSIPEITNLINKGLASYGLKTNIFAITRQNKESMNTNETPNTDNPKITFHPSVKVSVIVINTAYNIAKVIFEFDNKLNLLKNREEKIK